MHTMVRSYGVARTLSREAPAAVGALVIAELFYKFGSFTLECLGFLVTWYTLSLVLSLLFHPSTVTQTSR